MAHQTCTGHTKAGGRCKAYPVAGTDRCLAHSSEKTKESVGFGGPQEGAGRPRVPRVVEAMRERVEAEIDEVLAPYFDAVRHAVLHATSDGEVVLSEHPDLGARIAAAEKLLDRVYGRPRQAVEHTGPDGGGLALNVGVDEGLSRAAHDFLRAARESAG